MKRRKILPRLPRGTCMKRLMVGWICGLWCAGAVCAGAAGNPPFAKKPDPTQPVIIPWDVLDERATLIAKKMMERPAVQARGPVDTFTCAPEQYYWLLDNP